MMLLSYNYFHQRESKEIKEGCASLSFNRWRTGSGNFCIFLCSLQLFPRNPCLLLASFWHLTFSFWAFPAFAQFLQTNVKLSRSCTQGSVPAPWFGPHGQLSPRLCCWDVSLPIMCCDFMDCSQTFLLYLAVLHFPLFLALFLLSSISYFLHKQTLNSHPEMQSHLSIFLGL
jgi:hypothetical protein